MTNDITVHHYIIDIKIFRKQHFYQQVLDSVCKTTLFHSNQWYSQDTFKHMAHKNYNIPENDDIPFLHFLTQGLLASVQAFTGSIFSSNFKQDVDFLFTSFFHHPLLPVHETEITCASKQF